MSQDKDIDFEQYLGLPWHATGESLEVGFNCWTLVRYLFKTYQDINLPSVAFDASSLLSGVKALSGNKSNYKPVDIPQAFDIALMARRIEPCHVGLFIDKQHIIHAVQGAGVIITRATQLEAQGLILKEVYRWQG